MSCLKGFAAGIVLVVAASLAFATQASATNFCAVVSGTLPDCTPANTSTGATTAVQDALDDAFFNAGPDKVIIGAGTFTRAATQAFGYNAGATPGNDLEITGQGPSTILQPTGDPTNNYVLVLAASALTQNSVHDLKVNIPGTAGS